MKRNAWCMSILSILAVVGTAVTFWTGCSQEPGSEQSPVSAPALARAPVLTTYDVSNQSEFEDALWVTGPGDRIRIIASEPSWGFYTVPSGCVYSTWTCLDDKIIESVSATRILLPNGSTNLDNVSLKNITLQHSPIYGGEGVSMTDSDIRNVFYLRGSLSIGTIGVGGQFTADNCANLRLAVYSGATATVDSCWFYGATDECSQGYTTVSGSADFNVPTWRFGGTVYGGYSPLIVDKDIIAMSGCEWAYIRVEVADANAVVGTIFYGDNACTDGEITTMVVGNYHYAEVPISGYSDGNFYWRIRVRYCADQDWAEETSNCFKAKLTPGVPGCPAPEWWP